MARTSSSSRSGPEQRLACLKLLAHVWRQIVFKIICISRALRLKRAPAFGRTPCSKKSARLTSPINGQWSSGVSINGTEQPCAVIVAGHPIAFTGTRPGKNPVVARSTNVESLNPGTRQYSSQVSVPLYPWFLRATVSSISHYPYRVNVWREIQNSTSYGLRNFLVFRPLR